MSTPTPNNPEPRKAPAAAAGGIPTGKLEPAKSAPRPTSTAKPASGTPTAKPASAQAQNPSPSQPTKSATPPTGKIEPAAKPASAQAAPAKKPARKRSAVRNLGQVLVDLGFIDEAQLDSIEEEARTTDQTIEDVVRARVLVDEDQLLQAKAELHGVPLVNLDEVKAEPAALKVVPQNMAEIGKMVPLKYENDTLTVVMSDPNNLETIDNLKNMLGIQNVVVALASPSKIEAALKRIYSNVKEESIDDIIKSLGEDDDMFTGRRETSIDIASVEEMANAAPVRKLVNMILLMGIKDQASDIHFEPFEDEYKVRMRCDGVLYDLVPPPRHLATAISSRVKVMANLDIAERRLPQDGRIELNIGGSTVDMRVSVLPTMFGESVVIRVLDKGRVGLDLDKIGMPPDILAQFREVIRKPNGITLVTGPTGAGKTTTLYSALAELNVITDKIITTEDPVEYEIDGIVQCPINSEIDFTFASALRAILRQDPDKILVGEIRDLETAQIAIQAALTGHMVFSTLHTNDAPSTITRLRDMGVEPFLITATVEGIMAQRLVRRICTNCKQPYDPSRDQLMELNMKPADLKGRKFFFGEGCDKCNNMGYKGRVGLYEFLVVNDDIRDLISKGASTDQFRTYLRSHGVRSLRDSGIEALYAGLSTVEEVVRETVLEDEA
jgi:type IV pilus assembly protein PilB